MAHGLRLVTKGSAIFPQGIAGNDATANMIRWPHFLRSNSVIPGTWRETIA